MARPIQSDEPMLNGFASSQTTPLTATTPISSYPTPFPLPASHPHLPPTSTPAYSPITVPTGRTPLAQVKAMEPMELLMALCRDTRMGQFFSGPVDPPDFLRDAFPVEEELRCVGPLLRRRTCQEVDKASFITASHTPSRRWWYKKSSTHGSNRSYHFSYFQQAKHL